MRVGKKIEKFLRKNIKKPLIKPFFYLYISAILIPFTKIFDEDGGAETNVS